MPSGRGSGGAAPGAERWGKPACSSSSTSSPAGDSWAARSSQSQATGGSPRARRRRAAPAAAHPPPRSFPVKSSSVRVGRPFLPSFPPAPRRAAHSPAARSVRSVAHPSPPARAGAARATLGGWAGGGAAPERAAAQPRALSLPTCCSGWDEAAEDSCQPSTGCGSFAIM